jgi:D-alanyl-D-alanine dipeptidase
MPKWAKRLIVSLIFILVVVGCSAFVLLGYVKPYRMAENSMPKTGDWALTARKDGSIQVRWVEGRNAGGYIIQVLDGEKLLYVQDVGNTIEHVLPAMPDQEVTIRVSSYQSYRYLLPNNQRIRPGERSMEIRGNFTIPVVSDVEYVADAETDTVDVTFQLTAGATADLYMTVDTNTTKLDSLTDGKLTLRFGDTEALPIPAHGQTYNFSFDAHTSGQGYTYQGLASIGFSVERQDFLGKILNLTCTDMGGNKYQLDWNETQGDGYEVQIYDEAKGFWLTLLQVPVDGVRSCTTGHLGRYQDFTFRVIALEAAVQPAQVSVSTGASEVYSTIWPIKDLTVYADPDCNVLLTTAKAGKALCVLDVHGDLFYVRTTEGYGYLDSRYCMINLPDMIGDICLYDITNSYNCLYMVHEYEIPTITGQCIVGYEKIELSEGKYLVPLLYPTAKKLEKAAFDAISRGYKLKIYDSYRPNKTTQEIYDLAQELLEQPIPEAPFTDKVLEDMPVLEEGQVLTYYQLMTDNGRYALSNFLAKGGSRHNQGIALDLTLTKRKEDLEMQTSIHDLSWYSETKANNKEAKLLRTIMQDAGLVGLTSEWWHFQDNDAKKELDPPYMKNGVTPEGWVADDTGWRYRRSDGRFYKSCEKKIDGVVYTFDSDGYATA